MATTTQPDIEGFIAGVNEGIGKFRAHAKPLVDDPNPPNAPPTNVDNLMVACTVKGADGNLFVKDDGSFRLSTEEVAAINDAFLIPERLPQERINAAVPMRVSGGMAGSAPPKLLGPGGAMCGGMLPWDGPAPAVGEGLGTQKAMTLPIGEKVEAAPPTPAWSVQRELEARKQQTAQLAGNYATLERNFVAAQHRIVELEKRNAELEADRSGVVGYYEDVLATIEHPVPANDAEKRINDVIDDLAARKVSQPDRNRLRGAIDKADKPLAGRAGQDEGLGRAIGRTTGWRSL